MKSDSNNGNSLIDDLMLMGRVLTHNELKLYIYFRWRCNPTASVEFKQMMGYLDCTPAETVQTLNALIEYKIIMLIDDSKYAIVSAPDWLSLEERQIK